MIGCGALFGKKFPAPLKNFLEKWLGEAIKLVITG